MSEINLEKLAQYAQTISLARNALNDPRLVPKHLRNAFDKKLLVMEREFVNSFLEIQDTSKEDDQLIQNRLIEEKAKLKKSKVKRSDENS